MKEYFLLINCIQVLQNKKKDPLPQLNNFPLTMSTYFISKRNFLTHLYIDSVNFKNTSLIHATMDLADKLRRILPFFPKEVIHLKNKVKN